MCMYLEYRAVRALNTFLRWREPSFIDIEVDSAEPHYRRMDSDEIRPNLRPRWRTYGDYAFAC